MKFSCHVLLLMSNIGYNGSDLHVLFFPSTQRVSTCQVMNRLVLWKELPSCSGESKMYNRMTKLIWLWNDYRCSDIVHIVNKVVGEWEVLSGPLSVFYPEYKKLLDTVILTLPLVSDRWVQTNNISFVLYFSVCYIYGTRTSYKRGPDGLIFAIFEIIFEKRCCEISVWK